MRPVPASSEADDSLLIRATEAWYAARDRPEHGWALADAVINACGPGDEEALVAGLRARGWAERVLYRHAEAGATINRAIAIARRCKLTDQLVAVLISRASLYLEIGRSGSALRDIATARAALDGRPSIDLDAQEALVHMKFGQHARAVEVGLRARSWITDTTNPVIQVMILTNLGEALSHLGRFRDADQVFSEAVAVAETVGRLNLGMVLQTQAAAAVRGGRLRDGLAGFDRAEEILTETGWPLGEHYLERIESLGTLRLLAEAEESAQRARTHFEAAGFVLLLAEVLLRQGRLYLDDGRLDEAQAVADRATILLRRQRRRGYEAQAVLLGVQARYRGGSALRTDLRRAERAIRMLERSGALTELVDGHLLAGGVASAFGSFDVAQTHYETAGTVSRTGGALLRLKGAVAEALLARHRGDAVALRRAGRRGLKELARYRASLPSTDLRALAAVHGVELASLVLAATIETGPVDRVFEWMERGRLASVLTSAAKPADELLDELFTRHREIAGEVRGALDDPEHMARLSAEQVRLERRIQRRMRTVLPESGDAAGTVTARDVRRELQGRTLVEFAVVDDRIVAVTIGRRGRTWDLGDLEGPAAELRSLLFGLRRVLNARNPATRDAAFASVAHALERIDEQLILPIRGALGNEVVIAPTATLFAVPWHALPSLVGRRVSVTPSATVWYRARESRVPDGCCLVAAGPGLTGANAEVGLIASLHRDVELLVPPRATVGALEAALPRARLAHLACHGSFRSDNPSFSSLEFCDGPMTVLDLESIGQTPDVVVLASCDSGASQALPGDELRGFLSALFMLGTRAVVASAVPVPDVEATPLMVALHRGLAAGQPIGDALDVARAELDRSSPEGFVLATAFALYGAGHVRVSSAPVRSNTGARSSAA